MAIVRYSVRIVEYLFAESLKKYREKKAIKEDIDFFEEQIDETQERIDDAYKDIEQFKEQIEQARDRLKRLE